MRVIIVGAGECGTRAALSLRRQGFEGSILLTSAEDCVPYERPPLSKEALTAAGQPLARVVASKEQLTAHNIAYSSGVRVEQLDVGSRRVHLSNGVTSHFDRLLVATGATARTLDVGGVDHRRIVVLRTIDDALTVWELAKHAKRVLVVGGGFIGLEVAASCRTLGCKVELVEASDRLLSRVLPAEVASHIAEKHHQEGVSIRLGVTIAQLRQQARSVQVELSDGELMEVDFVVAGIGVCPETTLAERAGLRIENGVAVDSKLRTDVDGVFAAGDCCSFPLALYGGKRVRLESWRNAQRQGEHVAANILGADATFDAVPWFWTDQYNLTLHVAGLPNEGVETIVRDVGNNTKLWFHLDQEGRLVAASGLGVGGASAREVRFAEMLIAQRQKPSHKQLQDSAVSLRSLLV
jgi:3-phenylpropionate/trans-cinnamate dioxygenase ferredoxin reductase component